MIDLFALEAIENKFIIYYMKKKNHCFVLYVKKEFSQLWIWSFFYCLLWKWSIETLTLKLSFQNNRKQKNHASQICMQICFKIIHFKGKKYNQQKLENHKSQIRGYDYNETTSVLFSSKKLNFLFLSIFFANFARFLEKSSKFLISQSWKKKP